MENGTVVGGESEKWDDKYCCTVLALGDALVTVNVALDQDRPPDPEDPLKSNTKLSHDPNTLGAVTDTTGRIGFAGAPREQLAAFTGVHLLYRTGAI